MPSHQIPEGQVKAKAGSTIKRIRKICDPAKSSSNLGVEGKIKSTPVEKTENEHQRSFKEKTTKGSDNLSGEDKVNSIYLEEQSSASEKGKEKTPKKSDGKSAQVTKIISKSMKTVAKDKQIQRKNLHRRSNQVYPVNASTIGDVKKETVLKVEDSRQERHDPVPKRPVRKVSHITSEITKEKKVKFVDETEIKNGQVQPKHKKEGQPNPNINANSDNTVIEDATKKEIQVIKDDKQVKHVIDLTPETMGELKAGTETGDIAKIKQAKMVDKDDPADPFKVDYINSISRNVPKEAISMADHKKLVKKDASKEAIINADDINPSLTEEDKAKRDVSVATGIGYISAEVNAENKQVLMESEENISYQTILTSTNTDSIKIGEDSTKDPLSEVITESTQSHVEGKDHKVKQVDLTDLDIGRNILKEADNAGVEYLRPKESEMYRTNAMEEAKAKSIEKKTAEEDLEIQKVNETEELKVSNAEETDNAIGVEGDKLATESTPRDETEVNDNPLLNRESCLSEEDDDPDRGKHLVNANQEQYVLPVIKIISHQPEGGKEIVTTAGDIINNRDEPTNCLSSNVTLNFSSTQADSNKGYRLLITKEELDSGVISEGLDMQILGDEEADNLVIVAEPVTPSEEIIPDGPEDGDKLTTYQDQCSSASKPSGSADSLSDFLKFIHCLLRFFCFGCPPCSTDIVD